MSRAVAKTVLSVDLRKKRAPLATVAPTGRVPRVARLLALAHRIDRMVHDGEIRNLSEAARRLGLTRARVTQVMNLLLLAPEIQEAILERTHPSLPSSMTRRQGSGFLPETFRRSCRSPAPSVVPRSCYP